MCLGSHLQVKHAQDFDSVSEKYYALQYRIHKTNFGYFDFSIKKKKLSLKCRSPTIGRIP